MFTPSRFKALVRKLCFSRKSLEPPGTLSQPSRQYGLVRKPRAQPHGLAQQLPCLILRGIFSYLSCAQCTQTAPCLCKPRQSIFRTLTSVCKAWRHASLDVFFATIRLSAKAPIHAPEHAWRHARHLHVSLDGSATEKNAERLISQLRAAGKGPRGSRIAAITITGCDGAVSKGLANAIAAAVPRVQSIIYDSSACQCTADSHPAIIGDIVACLSDPSRLGSIGGVVPGAWACPLARLDLSRVKLAKRSDVLRVSSYHSTLQSLVIGSITSAAFTSLTRTSSGHTKEYPRLCSLTVLEFMPSKTAIARSHHPTDSAALAFPAVEHLVLGKGEYSIANTTYIPTRLPAFTSAGVRSILAQCGGSLQTLCIEYADRKSATPAITQFLTTQHSSLSRVKIMHVSPTADYSDTDMRSSRRLATSLFTLPFLQSLECLQPLDCTDIVPLLVSHHLARLVLPGSLISLQQLSDLLKAQQFLHTMCAQVASTPLEYVLPDGPIHQRLKSLSLSWKNDNVDIEVKGIHRRLPTLEHADFPISYYLQFM